MKHISILALALSGLCWLTGCAGGVQEAAVPEPVTADMLSQELGDALRADWAAYDALPREQQMLCSSLPGNCLADFDSWAEAETFLGISVPNPLEELDWLDRGTYVGMPVGYQDAPAVQTTWYGTREGCVEGINVQSGYRSGDLRVTLEASLYGEPSEQDGGDGTRASDLALEAYLDGADGETPCITEDSGERYASASAALVRGHVLYTVQVTGEPGAGPEARETLEQLLTAFAPEKDPVNI